MIMSIFSPKQSQQNSLLHSRTMPLRLSVCVEAKQWLLKNENGRKKRDHWVSLRLSKGTNDNIQRKENSLVCRPSTQP